MGQKTNPNIFRLGKTNDWKFKYFEKKSTELTIHTFKTIEIEDFINQFFKLNGLVVHNVKLYYFNDILHIFISYFLTLKTISIVYKNKKIQQKQLKQKYLKNIKKYRKYKDLNYLTKLIKNIENNFFNKNKAKIIKKKQIKSLKYYLLTQKYKNLSNFKINSFLEKLFENLSLFTNKQIDISLTLKQLNKNIKQKINKKKIKLIKKKLIRLRKYERNQFFKEGVNILFTCASNKNSATLLAKFIATELTKLKKHNFFLRFVKQTLTLFFNKTFSKYQGIKIKIKGRFNGAPRARHKIIQIGTGIPALTISSKIDYGEITSYTANGTFGVKVWIHEKN